MSFQESVEVWRKLGEVDPLWAILSDPQKEGGKWDPAEFFASGEREISDVIADITRRGYLAARGSALDFGCGVGRLTQPLARHFREVHGVDAAETMIEGARKFDHSNGVCRFHVNTRSDLKLFPDAMFDFIYSRIVLQHIPPENAKQYIAEFVRVLRPGGLLVFQVPSVQSSPADRPHPWRANLVAGPLTRKAKAGQRIALTVKVTNASTQPWKAREPAGETGCFRLGNHWLTREGSVCVMDDGRIAIPHDIQPGESCELQLDVTAPAQGGRYILEFDMVQEGVCWFKDYGSDTFRFDMAVTPLPSRIGQFASRAFRFLKAAKAGPPASPSGVAETSKPQFSMNAVPRDEVLKIIADNGGKLLSVEDDASAGSAWISYLYYVTRD